MTSASISAYGALGCFMLVVVAFIGFIMSGVCFSKIIVLLVFNAKEVKISIRN